MVIIGSFLCVNTVYAEGSALNFKPLVSENNYCNLTFTRADIDTIRNSWGVPEELDTYFLSCGRTLNNYVDVTLFFYSSKMLELDVTNNQRYIKITNGKNRDYDDIRLSLLYQYNNKSTGLVVYYNHVTYKQDNNYNLIDFKDVEPEYEDSSTLKSNSRALNFAKSTSSYDVNSYYYTNNKIFYNYLNDYLDPVGSSYTFNEVVKTKGINKIKFDFKFPNPDNSIGVEVGIDYLIGIHDDSKCVCDTEDSSSDCVHSYYDMVSDREFSPPYIEYTRLQDGVLNTHTRSLTDDFWYYYTGTHALTIQVEDYKSYSLVLNVENIDFDLYVKFSSTLDYDVTYITSDDERFNYITIDMKDYEQLTLIPKFYDMSSNSVTFLDYYVYLNGMYDIYVYEDLKSNKFLYDGKLNQVDYIRDTFIFNLLDTNFKNSSIAFIKKRSEFYSDYTIRFDANVFDYSLKKYLTDKGSIHNSNTGEDIDIDDTSHLYNSSYEDLDSGSLKSALSYFIKPITFIMQQISNFYGSMPFILQRFFYFIFGLGVIIAIIRIIF